jgi:hypothetical protein
MKRAFLIFGEYRDFDKSIIHWDFKEDDDFYMSTWGLSDLRFDGSGVIFNVKDNMITDYLPNCKYEIVDRNLYYPQKPLDTTCYMYFHWKNVYKLFSESNKQYDIVFLVRSDSIFKEKNHNLEDFEFVFNKDLLYGEPMFNHDKDENIILSSDTFFFGSQNVMNNFLSKIPERFCYKVETHKDIAEHIISLGYKTNNNYPYFYMLYRTFKKYYI